MATAPQFPVNTRTRKTDWKALVEEHENLNAPHVAYQFNKRTFKEADSNGVYDAD